MGTVQAAGAAAILERQAAERQSRKSTELKLDGSNKVTFPGFPYEFEALEERILVVIDVFKSGYECSACVKGHVKYQCSCTQGPDARPGFKFNLDQLNAIQESLGEAVADARKDQLCPVCNGDPVSVERDESCTACKGTGIILELPDDSKNLPTTGVVVSMGHEAQAHAQYGLGDRILFGPHAGGMIPTKAAIMLRYMDWQQAICRIGGADDQNAFDFIMQA